MKDAMGRRDPAVVVGQANSYRKSKKRTNEQCSICSSRIWFDATHLMEPVDAPEPRHNWVLCRECYQALVVEMRRSPVRSPLRLRIAMGIVAADRWPRSSSSSFSWVSDRRRVAFIFWAFFIAMILHLALIVMIAVVAR
jgi:hypothetical protein